MQEPGRIVECLVVRNGLEDLADDPVRRSVSLRRELCEQDQLHDGRVVAMVRPRQHVVPHLDGRVGGVATAGYPIRIRFSTTEWWLPGTSPALPIATIPVALR